MSSFWFQINYNDEKINLIKKMMQSLTQSKLQIMSNSTQKFKELINQLRRKKSLSQQNSKENSEIKTSSQKNSYLINSQKQNPLNPQSDKKSTIQRLADLQNIQTINKNGKQQKIENDGQQILISKRSKKNLDIYSARNLSSHNDESKQMQADYDNSDKSYCITKFKKIIFNPFRLVQEAGKRQIENRKLQASQQVNQNNFIFQEDKEKSQYRSTINRDRLNSSSQNNSNYFTQKKLNKLQAINPKVKNISHQEVMKFLKGNNQELKELSSPKQIYSYFSKLYNHIQIPFENPFIKKYKNCIYFGKHFTENQKYQGFLYYFDNRFYYGQFLNGQKHDHGTQIIHQSKNKFKIWIGMFKNGKKTGKFILKAQNQEYIGYVVNGKYHGQGKLTTDRSVYEGFFENGLKHGYGQQYFFRTGLKYQGDFKNGKFQKAKVKEVEISKASASDPQFRRTGKINSFSVSNNKGSTQRIFNKSPPKNNLLVKNKQTNDHYFNKERTSTKMSEAQNVPQFIRSRKEQLSKVYLQSSNRKRRSELKSRGSSSLAYRKITNQDNQNQELLLDHSSRVESSSNTEFTQPKFIITRSRNPVNQRNYQNSKYSDMNNVYHPHEQTEEQALPKPTFYPFG